MKSELKKVENSIATFTMTIEPQEFKEALQRAYNENKHRFNVHGFRKGKAPRRIIEMNYGKEVFYEDAVNLVLADNYEETLDELKLSPIDYPKVSVKSEIDPEKEIEVEFNVQLKPEAKLGEYKSLKAEVLQKADLDKEVEARLEAERQKNARMITIEDRAAENEDTANIDFEGFVDGIAFEGGKGESYDLVLGSATFIPGFEDQIVGKKVGETFEVNVTFPEDYHENLKGKDAIFKVTLNSLKKKELPELDDDFAMDVSEFDTLEAYKADLREKADKELDDALESRKASKAVLALTDITEVDLPQVMVEKQVENEIRDFEQRLGQMGISLDQYIKMTGIELITMKNQMRPQAEARVKQELALEAFAKAENIEVSDEEIDNELKELAKIYQREDVDKYIEEYRSENDLNGITDFIKNRKTIEKLVEMVEFTLVEKESPKEEEKEEETK